MKIGIMGGSFNPIHHMHLLMGEMAYEEFGLDQVLIMPLKTPYFDNKTLKGNSTDEDRVAMIKLAIGDNDHLAFSDLELKREGVTYTVDTLEILNKMHPENEYYFILGADSLFGLERWYRAERIFELATIIAASRDDSNEKIDDQITYLNEKYGARVLKLHSPNLEISSSYIRDMAGKKRSTRYLVPEGVFHYMKEHGLYE